jgi:hypothetical protein
LPTPNPRLFHFTDEENRDSGRKEHTQSHVGDKNWDLSMALSVSQEGRLTPVPEDVITPFRHRGNQEEEEHPFHTPSLHATRILGPKGIKLAPVPTRPIFNSLGSSWKTQQNF